MIMFFKILSVDFVLNCTQDFTIQQLQRRLARLEGEVNVEEKKELEARLTTMTLLLEDRTASHSLLVNQLKSIRVR